ncbi:hypothetical protein J7439_25270, partial [Salinisphaera sp. G21_0]
MENTKDKARKASQNLRHQYDKSAAPTLPASQLPNTPLALGALVGLSAVGAASASAPDTDPWTEVGDAETLGNICHVAKLPCSKQYRLIKDIDGRQLSRSIGNETNPFTGKLDGNNRIISKSSKCLVKHLSAGGRIENLNLSDATITSTESAGVVACEMSGNATIGNIWVERANVATSDKSNAYAAIGVGKVSGGGTITSMTALNCRVKTSAWKAYAGIGAGNLASGAVNNMIAKNCNVTTEWSYGRAGIGAGNLESSGAVNNMVAVNCNVTTERDYGHAGIGAGNLESSGAVNNMTAVNCNVTAEGHYGYTGIGAGSSTGGIVNNTMAVNCHVEMKGEYANAGIGVGKQNSKGTVTDTTALNCTVKTHKPNVNAGIGAGFSGKSTVNNTTAVNCDVVTIARNADAGIGAGFSDAGTVDHTTAVNCTVTTSGSEANAGIGAGVLDVGTVNHTTAVNCTVITSGEKANAGIGAGRFSVGQESIANTRVINSAVKSENATAGIFGGYDPVICNVTVNGVQQNDTAKGCQYWQDNHLCAVIDPDLAKLNPQIANYCPAPPTKETVAKTPGSTMNSFSSGSDTTTTPPTTMDTAPDTTMNSFSSDSVTTTTPPTTMATAPDTTMNSFSSDSVTTTTPPTTGPEVQKVNFSDPGSATFAAPSPAIIACIATLGTMILVLVGVIAYRYYSQRSSTNAGRNRAEPMPPPPSSRPRAEGQLVT